MITAAELLELKLLIEGVREPSSGMERHFLRVISGKASPCTPKENEWHQYWISEKSAAIVLQPDESSFDLLDYRSESPRVGAINGLHVVFDPQLQLADSKWVSLFSIIRNEMMMYQRRYAKTVCQLHQLSHPKYQENLEIYRAWRSAISPENLEDLFIELRVKDANLRDWVGATERMHKEFLSKSGKPYPGIREPNGGNSNRGANCNVCKTFLGSEFNVNCKACGWMVCSSCGACGCRFIPNYINDSSEG
ncbi:MAG TPA: hypothetical protein PKH72_10890 [Rhodoferax sp.]|nr:hypothetical protein [Rhodoferax sp.]HPW29518.1 hypothetical protein [Rhodoferax sp.]